MIVLDTHVWLWWMAEPRRLSAAAAEAIDQADSIGVATISCWEIAMLVGKGRVRLDRDPALWVRQALGRERVRALPLEPGAAVDAALIADDELRGDPADRTIYATARAEGARLVTKDARLRGFDPRGTLW